MFDYILLKNAEKFLLKLPQNEQRRIIQALDSLLNNATNLDIKKLKGRLEFRLRVGKYRILFIEDTDNNLYVITTIGSRGDVYK